jgi:hypothetical protein
MINMSQKIDLIRRIVIFLRTPELVTDKSLTDVARIFGVTRQEIRRVMTKYGIQVGFSEQKRNGPEDAMNYIPKVLIQSEPKDVVAVEEDLKVESFVSPDPVHSKPRIVGLKPRNIKGKVATPIPEDKQQYIRDNCETKPMKVLIAESGLSEYKVKLFMVENKLKRVYTDRSKSEKKRLGRVPFSIPEDVQCFLRERYTLPSTVLSKECGISKERIKRFLKANGLERPRPDKPTKKVRTPKEKKSVNAVKKAKGKAPTVLPTVVQSYLRENRHKPWSQLSTAVGYSYSIVKGFMCREGVERPKRLKIEKVKKVKVIREKKVIEPKERVRRITKAIAIPLEIQVVLLENVKRPWAQLSKETGLSYPIVRAYLDAKGYKPDRSWKRVNLPEAVESFLKENYTRPWTVLAEECGYSLSLVRRFMRDNGLKRPRNTKEITVRKLSQELTEEVRTFLKENASRSWTHLAEENGLTLAIIKGYLEREGYTRPKHGQITKKSRITDPRENKPRGKKPYQFSDDDRTFILSYLGNPITKVAKVLGVTPAILKGYLKKEGLYTVKPRKAKAS